MVAPRESTYKERLAAAMERASADVHSVAKALDISYTAVKKVVDGKSNALTAENNAKAARFLKVDSDWLATGEGEPNFGVAKVVEVKMPFRDLVGFEVQAITFFRQLTPDQQHAMLLTMNELIPKSEESSAADPFATARRKRRVAPGAN